MKPELKKLIDFALSDGAITAKEREIIKRKAVSLNDNVDEAMNYLDEKLAQNQKLKDNDDLTSCPNCGDLIPLISTVCPSCGHLFAKERKDNIYFQNFKQYSKKNLSYYNISFWQYVKKHIFLHILVLSFFVCHLFSLSRFGMFAYLSHLMFYFILVILLIYVFGYLIYKIINTAKGNKTVAKELEIELKAFDLYVKTHDTQGKYDSQIASDMLIIDKAKKKYKSHFKKLILYYCIFLVVFMISFGFSPNNTEIVNKQSLIIKEKYKDIINYKKELKLLSPKPESLNEIVNIDDSSNPLMEITFQTKSPEEYKESIITRLDFGFQIFINNINIVPKKTLTKDECNEVLSLKVNLYDKDKNKMENVVFYISDSNKKEYLPNLLSNKSLNNVVFQTNTFKNVNFLNEIKSNAEYYIYTTK